MAYGISPKALKKISNVVVPKLCDQLQIKNKYVFRCAERKIEIIVIKEISNKQQKPQFYISLTASVDYQAKCLFIGFLFKVAKLYTEKLQ